MSGFWDKVNEVVDGVVHPHHAQSGALPDDYDVSEVSHPPYSAGSSPDAVKQALRDQGYTPPEQIDPYALDQARQFGQITNRSSPFTVIDLTPATDNGTRAAGAAGQKVISNTQPANASTLEGIGRLFNMPIFTLLAKANALANASRPGVTYSVPVIGNSLRIDRLPSGFQTSGPSPITLANTISIIGTPLINNDVYVQNAINSLLSGIFVQFDSIDSPIFVVKPGETYDVVFSQIYITTFGSAGRFRVIAGNNARVSGSADERGLRQSLHMWDGGGMLDSPMYHPVPWSWQQYSTTGQFNYLPIISNFDDGSKLTQQSNGNTVGSVINKGYMILWVTGIAVDPGGGGILSIYKGTGIDPSAPSSGSQTFPSYLERNYPTNGRPPDNINFAVPLRIVLGGFDCLDPSQVGMASGETLICRINQVGVTGSPMIVTLNGYTMGRGPINSFRFNPALIPFNPYPQDVLLPV